MKHRFLLLLVVFLACKKNKDKDDQNAPTILLSASLTNGHPNTRFSWSDDNKLTKIEFYAEEAPNGLISTAEIEYKAGVMSRTTSYTEPGHKAFSRTIVDSTSNGKIIKTSAYDLLGLSSNTPVSTSTCTYNAQGRMTKLDRRDKNNKVLDYINFSWFADGTIKQIDMYDASGNQLYLVSKRVFAVPGAVLAKGLEGLDPVLGAEYTAPFDNEAYQVYDYDQNGVVTFNRQYTMSAREYNADTSLKRQTITVKSIVPKKEDVVVFKQYEYIVR